MEGADLRYAKMEGADLSSAKMEGADLSYAKMDGADLSGAKMEGANLMLAKMDGANLRGAVMEGTDLSGASLKSAKLAMLRIESVMASLADFTASEGLTPEMLERFFGCAGTKLPDGMARPDHWHPTELKWDEQEEAYENWLATRKANRLPPFEGAAG